MKGLRSLVAAVAALALLVSPLAGFAAEQIPGRSPNNGLPGGVDIMGGWDFETSTWRAVGVDANGAVYTRPLYPDGSQWSFEIAADSLTRAVGMTPAADGIAFTEAQLYGYKVLMIGQKGYSAGTIAAGTHGGVIHRLQFSFDGTRWDDVLYTKVRTDSVGTIGAIDTFQVRVYANSTNLAQPTAVVALVDPTTGMPLPYPKFRTIVINRGAATVTYRHTYAYRQH